MHRSPPPSDPRHSRLAGSARVLLAVCVFAAGLLAAGAFTSAVPAAPQDCLPVLGCLTTTIPTVPLPTVTLPTSTTTSGPAAGTTSTATTTSSGSTRSPEVAPETALIARASVRVRGHRARRVVEIKLRLSKPARVSALLTRSGRALARRQVAAHAGSSVLLVRVGRATKAGPARLALSYSSASGETARASYRLRLPR
jgi:hypothetical protein